MISNTNQPKFRSDTRAKNFIIINSCYTICRERRRKRVHYIHMYIHSTHTYIQLCIIICTHIRTYVPLHIYFFVTHAFPVTWPAASEIKDNLTLYVELTHICKYIDICKVSYTYHMLNYSYMYERRSYFIKINMTHTHHPWNYRIYFAEEISHSNHRILISNTSKISTSIKTILFSRFANLNFKWQRPYLYNRTVIFEYFHLSTKSICNSRNSGRI